MNDLKDFLDKSPTAFHAARVISSELDRLGYTKLDEREPWKLERGTGYYIVRDERSVIAFIPGGLPPGSSGFRIAASHLDSPLLKIKSEGAAKDKGAWRYPVETYGSVIRSSWMDRGLEVAGFVSWKDASGQLATGLWRSEEALAVIPSLAIHLNKDVNKETNNGTELNIQNHLAALVPSAGGPGPAVSDPLTLKISRSLNIRESDILSSELYLVPAEKAEYVGDDEHRLIMSGRLDNLAMAHAVLQSLPEPGTVGDAGIIAAWFDAEEVGSRTTSGALSLFLDEIVERQLISFNCTREDLLRARRSSFMISTDMAHAVHPNYTDRHDSAYAPLMGGGPVIKSHGQKHYATDVHSEGRIKAAAVKTGIRLQKLIFRSDLACGFTLGPLASASASIGAVDIGNPLWGMHSARETASLSDHHEMVKLLRECWKI